MIFNIIKTGNQMTDTRWSCKIPSKVITLPTEENTRDFCLCHYSASPCAYYELAFADIENMDDSYLNDYRKFLINPLSDTSTFSFVLIEKDGTEHIIYSETESTLNFGEVFKKGFNESQPLQVGVNVIWHNVVTTIGYGEYTIKTTQTDFGNEVSNTSHVFRVVKYDASRANGTIKVEVNNVGVTMNGKNWTGLFSDQEPFVNMVRLRGGLLLTDPDIEIESIEDGSREDRPIQTKLTDTYSISIERIPFDIGKSLMHEDIVMNWVVTDYNTFEVDLRNKELIIQSSSITNTPDYNLKTYELTAKSNISKLNRKFV